MAKIYIHIGLPKTATTSLQTVLFPNLEKEKINYLGLFQPRSSDKNHIINSLYNSISTENNMAEVQWLMQNELDKGIDVLVSEEMITVDNWQEKIENLFKIVSKYNYQFIVTVREPVSAMFSYYVELYKNFKREADSFRELALNNGKMKIYHYKTFFECLLSYCDESEVSVVKFEDIIKNDFTSFPLKLRPKGSFYMEKHNTKNEKENIILLKDNRNMLTQLLNYLRRFKIFRIVEKSSGISMPKKFKNLVNLFGFQTTVEIKKLSKQEKNYLQKELHDETLFLKTKFGIDYFNI